MLILPKVMFYIVSPILKKRSFWGQKDLKSSVTEQLQGRNYIALEISITSDMQMTPPLWQKVKKN